MTDQMQPAPLPDPDKVFVHWLSSCRGCDKSALDRPPSREKQQTPQGYIIYRCRKCDVVEPSPFERNPI